MTTNHTIVSSGSFCKQLFRLVCSVILCVIKHYTYVHANPFSSRGICMLAIGPRTDLEHTRSLYSTININYNIIYNLITNFVVFSLQHVFSYFRYAVTRLH